MRTPILIRDGSLLVLLDSELKERKVGDRVWEYRPKAPGLYRKALIDAVGLRGGDFLVNDDGDYGARTLKIWTNGTQAGPPDIELSADEWLTITTTGQRLTRAATKTRRNVAYEYDVEATRYSYQLLADGRELGNELDLEHLVFTISRRPGVKGASLPEIVKWAAFGAAAGVAATWLLKKGE